MIILEDHFLFKVVIEFTKLTLQNISSKKALGNNGPWIKEPLHINNQKQVYMCKIKKINKDSQKEYTRLQNTNSRLTKITKNTM
jgi:hypothetical protein